MGLLIGGFLVLGLAIMHLYGARQSASRFYWPGVRTDVQARIFGVTGVIVAAALLFLGLIKLF